MLNKQSSRREFETLWVIKDYLRQTIYGYFWWGIQYMIDEHIIVLFKYIVSALTLKDVD